MAANKLTVDPLMLEAGVMKLRTLLGEYEGHYKQMQLLLTSLELDSSQKAALEEASDRLKMQYDQMKAYLNNNVIEIISLAAKTYKKADS